MKHLKRFNEGIFTSDYDKLVKNLFDRIKEIFDESNLSYDADHDAFFYNLEETDSESGFIELAIAETGWLTPEYVLCIDDDEIKCSFLLKRKIYRFLKSNWKQKNLLRLQKKYDV